jgi:hypothetical protein
MHILVSEMEINGTFSDVNPDYQMLVSHNIPIVPVFRIDGQVPDSLWNVISDHIVATVNHIAGQKVIIQGIEIDYDGESSKLFR